MLSNNLISKLKNIIGKNMINDVESLIFQDSEPCFSMHYISEVLYILRNEDFLDNNIYEVEIYIDASKKPITIMTLFLMGN